VTISIEAFPGRQFEGKVDWVSGGVDPTMRTAKVRCILANADGALRPEMFATANIAVESGNQPSVPRTAVMHLGTELYVWVENGKTPDGKLRFVKTKIDADDSAGTSWIALRGGPPVGTRIVAAGGIILLGML
jgi:cobalt-zinc-cadmium efflux system membrane fusion protein